MASNLDTTAQLRFMATVRRQSAPPRCNPFLIVLQVLAIGMIFIGATMTLIAHWPGSTSIGENPLKIAGPVILGVGIAALVIGIALVCMVNRKEQRRWQKQMAKIISKRQNVDPEGTGDGQMPRNSVPMTIYPAKADEGSRPYSGAAADPFARPSHTYHDDSADMNASSVVDGDNVPMPVRVKKPRRPKDRSGEGEMSSSEDLTASTEPSAKADMEQQNAAPKKRRRPKVDTSQDEGQALMAEERDMAALGAGSGVVQPSPGEARRLKVHIKAQPGASVRIQNAPPPVAPKPAYRAKPHDVSTTSTGTDI